MFARDFTHHIQRGLLIFFAGKLAGYAEITLFIVVQRSEDEFKFLHRGARFA